MANVDHFGYLLFFAFVGLFVFLCSFVCLLTFLYDCHVDLCNQTCSSFVRLTTGKK